MSIERTYYCDRTGCGLNGPGDEFHTVSEMRDGPERHFCSWGCLRKFIADLLDQVSSTSMTEACST